MLNVHTPAAARGAAAPPFVPVLACALAALCALGTASCTEATVIGADDFVADALEVTFTDTLAVRLATVAAETSLAGEALADGVIAVYVGCVRSEATGDARATLGLSFVEAAAPRLDLDAVAIDSLVLVLPVIPALTVGDPAAELNLTVESVAAGSIDGDGEATFADSLAGGGTVYGAYSGVPPTETVTVNTFAGDSVRVDSVSPQLRIPLGDDFRRDVLAALRRRSPADTLVDDEAFVDAFPGVLVRGADCGEALAAVSLAAADAPQLGITVYYTEGGVRRQFRLVNRRLGAGGQGLLNRGTPLRVAYDRDYGDAPAAALLSGDDVDGIGAVVQGLQGANARVTFEEIAFGSERGVNFAELVIPVVDPEEVPGAASPIEPFERLILRVRNPSGDLVHYSAIPDEPVYTRLEGGVLETVADPRGGADSVRAYRFNVTTLLQDVVAGEREPEVFITPLATNLLAGESLLVGEGEGELRARLRVVTTALP